MKHALLTLAMFLGLATILEPVRAEDGPDGPEAITVYLTREEALEEVFGAADTVRAEIWRPTAAERNRLQRRLGWKVEDVAFEILRGEKDGQATGWAMIVEEVGLYHPITFIVKIGPDRQVDRVRVMVYRESRGAEVRRTRFLGQYAGKHLGSPVRINRDIIGITGATLSVRALNAGVKRALAIVDTAYPETGR